ncbi:MAG: redox-regulated ATPase YchF [Elusimicrobia bacterium]|nr:redox-regulated ATPase YchF [Elusimicrobiota bacterium]
MEIGIIGLPNAGKSTLFNALTKGHAPVSGYPFTTIDSNVGIVAIPDTRLDFLFDLFQPQKKTPAHIKFIDIAGLVKGASRGEGLGNRFLAYIREADAVLHLVRTFENPEVSHILGSIDPVRDVEIVETELILSDLESAEKALQKTETAARTGDKNAKEKKEKLEKIKICLSDAKPASASGLAFEEIREFNLLTSKPVLYAANISEKTDRETLQKLKNYAESKNSGFIEIYSKLEEEMIELEELERQQFLKELGIEISGLEKVITESKKLLNLISFFTVAGKEETRAWNIKHGAKAPQAAGKIHSDMEKGFIRAEVYNFSDIEKHKNEKILHEKGLIRSEGKDYVIKEGDVCLFKFTPFRDTPIKV